MMLKISNLIFLILTTVNIITASPIINDTIKNFINGTFPDDENSSYLTIIEVIYIICFVIWALCLFISILTTKMK
ncbi:hypothetical protein A0H76_611 [Hepatospora eriocheir]|uniref:Uncharacterized protein n=1 Tax=Hepatospora eriocheir TaxID=1081669 RepID=A0A1X0Q7S6_9MICR|nr:hypothetical protein A0H76_611 [Hepatospora eriocheir]